MGFDALLSKVKQAEDALETREREAAVRWRQLKGDWRAAWTPGRIVVVGLVSGFVFGRSRALRGGGGSGVLALVRTLAPMLAGLQAGVQTAQAAQEEAVEDVQAQVAAANAGADVTGIGALHEHA